MRTLSLLTALLLCAAVCPAVAQQSSREEFQEYGQAMQGRWVGDITWVADWPGLGKKGDKVTAYIESTLTEDGHALITKFYGGNGSGTGMVAFDPLDKQIKAMWVVCGGYVGHTTIHKVDGKWVEKGVGALPDGTKNEFTSTLTISDNGNTRTSTGSGTLGGKKVDDQHDVWRRVSK